MANRIFENILTQEIEDFRNSFANVSKKLFVDDNDKLLHPGEFGMYREAIVRKFLKSFAPGYLGIDQGFLINSNDENSSQCDIILYDSRYTPLLKNKELQRFFPIETVSAIGEVKSNLDFVNFKTALLKLAYAKKMSEYIKNPSIIYRHQTGDFSPQTYPYDLITSFLICQKLNFNPKRITEVYDDNIEVRHRHNMILSIEDGLLLYDWSSKETTSVHYLPTIDGKRQQHWAMYSLEDNGINCFKVFCNYLFDALCFRTTMFTQISNYMKYP